MLAILAKHRESVEGFVECNLFETGTIDIDDVEIEISASFTIDIGRKNDPLSIGVKERGKTRLSKICDLLHIFPVGIHYVYFQDGWPEQIIFDKIIVIIQLFRRLRPARPENDS